MLNYTAGALRYKGTLSNFQANTVLMKVIIQGFSSPHLLFMSGLLLWKEMGKIIWESKVNQTLCTDILKLDYLNL